jgi:hypothetical protein
MTRNKHTQETGLLALHAIGHSQIVTAAVKQATNRRRPVSRTAEQDSGKAAIHSLPAMRQLPSRSRLSSPMNISTGQVVPIVSYTVASAVSLSRVGAQRHWVSDIVVGGSVGFLIGRYVYKRHHDPTLPGGTVSPRNRLVPEVSVDTTTLALNWEF